MADLYTPKVNALRDVSAAAEIILTAGAGHLITHHGANGFASSFIPFLPDLDSKSGAIIRLRGHLARANPHVTALQQGGNSWHETIVLCVPYSSYVSPAYDPQKKLTHKVAPTWNYSIVRIHGRVRLVDDKTFVAGVVNDLTDEHERRRALSRSFFFLFTWFSLLYFHLGTCFGSVRLGE